MVRCSLTLFLARKSNPGLGMTAVPSLTAALLFLFLGVCAAESCHAQSGQVPYRLIGTISGPARSSAVIDEKTAGQSVYHEQELLPDGSRIKKILSDRITLVRSDGTSFDLYINSASQVEISSPPATVREQPPAQVQTPVAPAPLADNERLRHRRRNRSSGEE